MMFLGVHALMFAFLLTLWWRLFARGRGVGISTGDFVFRALLIAAVAALFLVIEFVFFPPGM